MAFSALSELSKDKYPKPLLSILLSFLYISIFTLVIFPYLLNILIKSSFLAFKGIFLIYKLHPEFILLLFG